MGIQDDRAAFLKRQKDEQRERLKDKAPLVYPQMLEPLRFIARINGYALTVHGSQIRDFDLVACPWTDRAAPQMDLATAIWRETPCLNRLAFPAFEAKPCGRIAFEFIFFNDEHDDWFAIDLSVMPRGPQ